MSQRSAQYRVAAQPPEPQQAQWCDIGIHAVAAASIYRDRDAKRREGPAELPYLIRQTDYATD